MAESKLLKGAREAVAVARGEEPAARIHFNRHAYVPETALKESQCRVELLEEQVATAYQIVGCLADHAGLFENPDVIRALDYLAYGKTEDGTPILPWGDALGRDSNAA